VVTSGSASYIATAVSTNQAPPNPAYWLNISLGPKWTALLGVWAILPGRIAMERDGTGFITNYASFTSLERENDVNRTYAYYSGASFPADQYIQATVNPANSVVGICTRMSPTKPITAYCAVTGSRALALYRFVKGVGSALYTGAQIAPLSTLKLMAQSHTLSLYVNGVLQTEINDASITSGYPGLYGQNFVTPDNVIDDVYVGSATWSGLVETTTGVYEAGVLNENAKTYISRQALKDGTVTHSFSNGFSFTSAATFGCSCTDQTAPNACQATPISASTVHLAGTSSDVVWLSCTGH
jgi:hypothetical protein